ncbi:AlpA family phage regulatory protein [Gammaproteobacteria bacterium]|nr:AlpA family phage regulatory protein [Gammaproteobacteria bacterium]
MSTHTHSINRPTRRRLKIAAVEERLGVHRQTIWRWTKAGVFPSPHFLGYERQWFEDEIEHWEVQQMTKRATEKRVVV